MEHIEDILRRRTTQINTSKANTGTWSAAEDSEEDSTRPYCSVCRSAGFVHPLLPSGKPDYSRVIACHCTSEKLARERVKQQSTSLEYTWGPEFELQKSMTFDNFDLKRAINLPPEQLEALKEKGGNLEDYLGEIRQNLKGAYRLALDFAESPEGWLVFQGAYGCGKTHLAAAIANYRFQAKQPALFLVVPEFLDHLRSAFNPESKVSYDQLFERVKNAPLLILDDFGEQSTTPWAQEKLYQVINYRYNARLPTVITTSYALKEIERRISSRLVDQKISTPFNIMAPEFRVTGDVVKELASRSARKTYRRGKKERWDYET